MRICKMEGLGNDYFFFEGEMENPGQFAIKISDRHKGLGSDGIILILPSERADFRMRIFNADGSEALMCGNGIRCLGKYVYEKGLTYKTTLKIETLSGIRTIRLKVRNGIVKDVSVDMGVAEVGKPDYLYLSDIIKETGGLISSSKAVDKMYEDDADNLKIYYYRVSVGNSHAVIFVDDAEHVPVEKIGALVEQNKRFPDGVNVEFVQVLERNTLRMRVFERGSGVTMACGTGAAASAAAAVKAGFCEVGREVKVILDGGPLQVKVSEDGQTVMTGPAEYAYEVSLDITKLLDENGNS